MFAAAIKPYHPTAKITEVHSKFLETVGISNTISGEWTTNSNNSVQKFDSKNDDITIMFSESNVCLFTLSTYNTKFNATVQSMNCKLSRSQVIKKLMPQARTEFTFVKTGQVRENYPSLSRGSDFIFYREKHPYYPIFPVPGVYFGFYEDTNNLISFESRIAYTKTFDKPKLTAAAALRIARATAKEVRRRVTRDDDFKPIIGPRSPILVIHIFNQLADIPFIERVIKAGYWLPGSKVGAGPFLNPDSKVEKWNKPIDAVCWMVNIDGDICCVNAATGQVHYWRFAEQGTYFQIDKSGNLSFERK